MRLARLPSMLPSIALVALALGCAGSVPEPPDYAGVPQWTSRATAEARGEIKTPPDTKRQAVRYKGWTTRDFGKFRTYGYGDTRPEPAVVKAAMPAGVKGDPKKGRALFRARAKGPCTGCHLIPGDDVWPAGSVGPDVSLYGDPNLPDDFIFTQVYDSRNFFPNTTMPPWGTTGVFKPEELVHVVAFLKTLK